jgi:hypothetical protein
MEIKTGFIQLLHTNPFTIMDPQYPINHMRKVYEIVESLGASVNEEENLFLRLFPCSIIGRGID